MPAARSFDFFIAFLIAFYSSFNQENEASELARDLKDPGIPESHVVADPDSSSEPPTTVLSRPAVSSSDDELAARLPLLFLAGEWALLEFALELGFVRHARVAVLQIYPARSRDTHLISERDATISLMGALVAGPFGTSPGGRVMGHIIYN
ncbi:hypothetical protein EVAR_46328_1 [Eumeta japonica]|uniref:Uncharacterized protein n=1 Tax=Eumeta variegata TaxID=151549 RepID=A0A4C1WWL4_EUMVA|nr:hypothetical protein EVAR_46328_1 [Eumeta japonica]